MGITIAQAETIMSQLEYMPLTTGNVQSVVNSVLGEPTRDLLTTEERAAFQHLFETTRSVRARDLAKTAVDRLAPKMKQVEPAQGDLLTEEERSIVNSCSRGYTFTQDRLLDIIDRNSKEIAELRRTILRLQGKSL